MKNLKRLLMAVMAVVMLTAMTMSASANITTDGGTGETIVHLTAEPGRFSVTVPTSISIHVSGDGSVVPPSNVQISNDSAAAVQVTSVAMKNGSWSLVSYDTDMSTQKVDSKKLAFQMTVGTDVVSTTVAGNQTLDHDAAQWVLNGKDATLPIACAAKASAVSAAVTEAETAASIVFTVGWAS